MKKAVVVVALMTLIASGSALTAAAEENVKPINLALWESIQIYDKSTTIHGLRLNIYGANENVTGLDLGFVHAVPGVFKGVQLGLVGMDGDMTGWQATLVNISNGKMTGVQGSYTVYNSSVTAKGVQFGLVNRAESFEGLQLGLFNVTDTLHGIQIGLLNVVGSREKWKYLPIVSWSF